MTPLVVSEITQQERLSAVRDRPEASLSPAGSGKTTPRFVEEDLIARIAIAGAVAYDTICTTSSQLGIPLKDVGQSLLNLKIDTQFRAHGGCAANLAYSLCQLSHSVDIVSISGRNDDDPILAALNALGANTEPVLRIPGHDTAHATIITDPQGDQFTAFFPGPTVTAQRWQPWAARSIAADAACFVQAPFAPDLSLAGMSTASQSQVPVFWCPGQYADQMNAEEINALLPFTNLIIGNRHEISHLRARSDLSGHWVIETNSADTVTVYGPSEQAPHPAVIPVPASTPTDPTGCGDALIAGFVHQLIASSADCAAPALDKLVTAVEAGIELAQACLAESGSQAHSVAAILTA